MALSFDSDLFFGHRFQHSTLCFGWSPVDLIGQHNIRKNRAPHEPELPVPVRILLEQLRAGDVAGHEIGGELDAPEIEMHRLGEGADHQRLGQPRDPHQQGRMVARMAMAALPTRWFEDLIGLLDSVDSFVLADHLHRISCPTLIIAAGEDGFIPRQHCRALADGIPGARFEVIEGAGHAVVAEQPDEVVRLTKAFLATL